MAPSGFTAHKNRKQRWGQQQSVVFSSAYAAQASEANGSGGGDGFVFHKAELIALRVGRPHVRMLAHAYTVEDHHRGQQRAPVSTLSGTGASDVRSQLLHVWGEASDSPPPGAGRTREEQREVEPRL